MSDGLVPLDTLAAALKASWSQGLSHHFPPENLGTRDAKNAKHVPYYWATSSSPFLILKPRRASIAWVAQDRRHEENRRRKKLAEVGD